MIPSRSFSASSLRCVAISCSVSLKSSTRWWSSCLNSSSSRASSGKALNSYKITIEYCYFSCWKYSWNNYFNKHVDIFLFRIWSTKKDFKVRFHIVEVIDQIGTFETNISKNNFTRIDIIYFHSTIVIWQNSSNFLKKEQSYQISSMATNLTGSIGSWT